MIKAGADGDSHLLLPIFHFLTCLHRLVDYISDGIYCLPLHPLGGVGVSVQCKPRAVVAQRVGESFHVHTVLQGQCREGMT